MRQAFRAWRQRASASCQGQKGQALVEYAIVGGALAVAMFWLEYGGGKTGAQYLTDMIREFFRNMTYYLSLP
jgi:hypothetical protein